eukprot:365799-Chlamydomonas_euryale.AAC.5
MPCFSNLRALRRSLRLASRTRFCTRYFCASVTRLDLLFLLFFGIVDGGGGPAASVAAGGRSAPAALSAAVQSTKGASRAQVCGAGVRGVTCDALRQSHARACVWGLLRCERSDGPGPGRRSGPLSCGTTPRSAGLCDE